jgi:predicted DNA binding CopG/RHH family protein
MKKDKNDLKSLPVHLTDAEAENFTDTSDLSEYDLSGFKPVRFEFQKKDARLELRMPQEQLEALKELAAKRGIPHTRLVRQFIDEGMHGMKP